MEREGQERNSAPDAETEVDNPSLDEEALDTSVEPVEEPLLGCIGAVVENITSCKRRLLVEVFFAIPGSPVLVWHSQPFSVAKSHVLDVAVVIVLKSSSYTSNCYLSSVTHLPLMSIVL